MRRVVVLGVVGVAGLAVLWFALAELGLERGGEERADVAAEATSGAEPTPPVEEAERVPRARTEADRAAPPSSEEQEDATSESAPFEFEVLRDDLPRGTVLVVEREDPDEKGWYVWSYVDPEGDRKLRPFARLGGWAQIHMRLADGRFVVHVRDVARSREPMFSLVNPYSGEVAPLIGAEELEHVGVTWLEHVGVTPLGLLARAEHGDEPRIEFIGYDSPNARVTAAEGYFERIEGRFPGGAMYTAHIVPPTADADTPTDAERAGTERWRLRLDGEELGHPLAYADYGDERGVEEVQVAPDGENFALTCWTYAEIAPTQANVVEIRDGRTGEVAWRFEQHSDAPPDTVWLDARRLRYLHLMEEADADGLKHRILHAVDVDIVTGERVGFHRLGAKDSELARAVALEVFGREPGLPPGKRGPFRLVETERDAPDGAELRLHVGSESVPVLEVGALTGKYHAFRPHWFSPARRHVFVGLGPDTSTREYALVTADSRERTNYTLANVRCVWWLDAAQ